MVVEMLVMEVINMKNTIIQEIEQSLLNYLDNSQLDVLHTVLCRCLDKVDIKMVENTDIHISVFTNMELINKFIAAKEIEGCSERTTKYYYSTLIKMDSMITKNVTHLTTDDLRMYLTEYQKINNCSKASIDNIRRNLSSFFSWLEEENYILKSPMKRIHKIKTDKVIKETYSDETLELLRDNCNNLRDLAIIDLLSSTGMRVGELVRLNINDIDLLKGKLQSNIANAKSKILDLAIRGKLVPQNPNDEPASVLLERIRAEKEELIKQGKIKRDKKESVIFKGDDNSYYQDLPETWELVNFKDCATLISGRDLNKNEYNAESIGIPYITGASNFINENILINRWTTVPKIVSEVNDILITCKGTVGELAINKYGNIHIARQIMAIRIYKNINLEYIKFFLESIVMEIKKTANGLIPGISRDDILSLNIPLPPLAEQKRIVDEIEKIFATLDDIANQVA